MSSEIVASRVANALIEDAAPRFPNAMISLVGRAYGGLWVGGRATLTTTSLGFRPNAANRMVQTGSMDFELPLGDIAGVQVLPGVLTRIIAIRVPEAIVKIRCFGANAFADLIARQAGRPG